MNDTVGAPDSGSSSVTGSGQRKNGRFRVHDVEDLSSVRVNEADGRVGPTSENTPAHARLELQRVDLAAMEYPRDKYWRDGFLGGSGRRGGKKPRRHRVHGQLASSGAHHELDARAGRKNGKGRHWRNVFRGRKV
jgi:hypothetical protein